MGSIQRSEGEEGERKNIDGDDDEKGERGC